MGSLAHIRAVQEYNEIDTDQGVERIYLYYKHSSSHIYTDKQMVDIIESPLWGKMLFLDGVLQSTLKDEVIYHNALVHPLMNSLKYRDSILILGGGEGATAREVLRWPVKSVTMVDYDEELVEHMKIYGKEWSCNSFNDPRLNIIYDDAWAHLQSNVHYDAIIIDLTDPELKVQRWRLLLDMVMKCIKQTQGSFVMNAGMYVPWNIETIRVIKNMIVNLCSQYTEYTYKIYTTFVPSFNGEWTFIVVYRKEQYDIELENLSIIPAWIRRSMRALTNDLIDNKADTKANTRPIYIDE
jgi:spermidine synthase